MMRPIASIGVGTALAGLVLWLGVGARVDAASSLIVAEYSGSVQAQDAWGDGAASRPGQIRVGRRGDEAPWTGYMVFPLGSIPTDTELTDARLYVYVEQPAIRDESRMILVSYRVPPGYGPATVQFEQRARGGELWEQINRGYALAQSWATDDAPAPPASFRPASDELEWFPEEPPGLSAHSGPADGGGWRCIRLGPAVLEQLRAMVADYGAYGDYARLALTSGRDRVGLALGGYDSVDREPRLLVTWPSRLEIVGHDGAVRVNGRRERLPFAASFDDRQSVRLEAIPDPGYVFAGWAGDVADDSRTIRLPMDRDWQLYAHFAPARPAGAAWLRISGLDGQVRVNGVWRWLPWVEAFRYGEYVRLEAEPDFGYVFDGWYGDITGNYSTITVRMDGDLDVYVAFRRAVIYWWTSPPRSRWYYWRPPYPRVPYGHPPCYRPPYDRPRYEPQPIYRPPQDPPPGKRAAPPWGYGSRDDKRSDPRYDRPPDLRGPSSSTDRRGPEGKRAEQPRRGEAPWEDPGEPAPDWRRNDGPPPDPGQSKNVDGPSTRPGDSSGRGNPPPPSAGPEGKRSERGEPPPPPRSSPPSDAPDGPSGGKRDNERPASPYSQPPSPNDGPSGKHSGGGGQSGPPPAANDRSRDERPKGGDTGNAQPRYDPPPRNDPPPSKSPSTEPPRQAPDAGGRGGDGGSGGGGGGKGDPGGKHSAK